MSSENIVLLVICLAIAPFVLPILLGMVFYFVEGVVSVFLLFVMGIIGFVLLIFEQLYNIFIIGCGCLMFAGYFTLYVGRLCFYRHAVYVKDMHDNDSIIMSSHTELQCDTWLKDKNMLYTKLYHNFGASMTENASGYRFMNKKDALLFKMIWG